MGGGGGMEPEEKTQHQQDVINYLHRFQHRPILTAFAQKTTPVSPNVHAVHFPRPPADCHFCIWTQSLFLSVQKQSLPLLSRLRTTTSLKTWQPSLKTEHYQLHRTKKTNKKKEERDLGFLSVPSTAQRKPRC